MNTEKKKEECVCLDLFNCPNIKYRNIALIILTLYSIANIVLLSIYWNENIEELDVNGNNILRAEHIINTIVFILSILLIIRDKLPIVLPAEGWAILSFFLSIVSFSMGIGILINSVFISKIYPLYILTQIHIVVVIVPILFPLIIGFCIVCCRCKIKKAQVTPVTNALAV